MATPLFSEAEHCFKSDLAPGSGLWTSLTGLTAVAGSDQFVFSGLRFDRLEDGPISRICMSDAGGHVQELSSGPNTDTSPCSSPDGQTVAFRSDRKQAGDFQLWLLDLKTGHEQPAPAIDGWVESLQYSPDGHSILLGVAGHGADIAAAHGATASDRKDQSAAWMPQVLTGDEAFRWRSLWVYDCRSKTVRRVSPPLLHIWEGSWCGNDAVVAIASPETAEHAWFDAEIFHFTLTGTPPRRLYKPEAQVGRLSASPDGTQLAFSEGATSDRGMVAGELRILKLASGQLQQTDTNGIDISFTHWQGANRLLLAGVRAFESVVANYDINTDTLVERWKSDTLYAHNGRYPQPAPIPGSESFLLSVSSHLQPIQILRIDGARTRKLLDFRHSGTDALVHKLRPVEPYRWKAPDGREIHGWLMRGPGDKPAPLVMDVHGGPIWRHAQFYLGDYAHWVMLAQRGYALFWPNPRGSTGRGQEFARLVVGDMCGADTQDHLSGLDQLVAEGIADPKRIGVTGGSYGGTMTNWLITQDQRFAAAVPQFPAANWLSRHLTSYFSRWLFTFLDGHYRDLSSKYYSRSPVLHAHQVRTPTLHIAGALDQVTPPTQALEFHNALIENGVESVLVTYPCEGHGVRNFPAKIDHAARLVYWFLRHMPPDELPRPDWRTS